MNLASTKRFGRDVVQKWNTKPLFRFYVKKNYGSQCVWFSQVCKSMVIKEFSFTVIRD